MRKHSLDVFSLLSGLLVVAFAVAYLAGAITDYRLDGRLAFPLLLVGLGVAGLVGALVAQRRSDRELDSGSTE
ncbi:MAG: hypothetical protein GC156_09370 [Actinomycetales bacterium]|nr:hypothetical protein [Actinomycetales bacterium]